VAPSILSPSPAPTHENYMIICEVNQTSTYFERSIFDRRLHQGCMHYFDETVSRVIECLYAVKYAIVASYLIASVFVM